MSRKVDVAIIGAGTAGLNAFRQVKQVTSNVVLINDGPYGTTCARVGCMPSKVLIEIAKEFSRKVHFDEFGIQGSEHLSLNRKQVMHYLREQRDWFVARVMDGVSQIGDKNIKGRARFLETQVLDVNGERIEADKIIIATGSRPIVPEAWKAFGDKVITTDDFFELEDLPDSMAVIGLGAIGCELGQALAHLGVKVVGIEKLSNVAGLSDPKVNQVAIDELGKSFEVWLGSAAQLSETADGKIKVETEDGRSIVVDKVLASLGRRANMDNMGLEVLNLDLSDGLKNSINPNTMQMGDLPVFIAGDVSSLNPILHEAGDEGTIAGYNAVHEVQGFKRRVPLRIAFTDPQVVSVGATYAQLSEEEIVIGERSFVVQGRTKIMARNHGLLRVYADRQSGRLLGSEMMIPDGEYIGHFLAMAIENALTVQKVMVTPFYHPTVLEGLDNALNAIVAQLPEANQGIVLERMS
jgi:dihydrolipoamide dehydrogenase